MTRPQLQSGRTGLVVQVRLGSSRLYRKALLPLGGQSLTDQVLSRLALVPAEVYVLATDEASSSELCPLAERHGFEFLVGPAEDVLARYCMAIRRFGIERLLRATGDNPLVSHELARLLLEDSSLREADYAAYTGMPLGMGTELVRSEALLRAESEARESAEREHVCPYLYGHPELFSIRRASAPAAYLLPEARVTVDTAADYEAMLRIYGALFDGSPIPSPQVLEYLDGVRDRK